MKEPDPLPSLVPIGQAAAYLGVSPKTLRRWEAQGLIAPLRTPGGERRYLLADLRKLLQRPPAGVEEASSL